MDFPSPSDIAKLGKDRNLKLVKQEGLNVGYLAFNVQKPPFDDVLVRKAVALAVNRKQIIKAVYEGMGRVAKNPLPPTMAAYNDDIKDHEYNPKEAKRLLKLAGFPRGFSSDLWAMPVARPYMPNARKVAEVIQADLAKIGIKIKIVSYEWGTYLSKTRKGEHPMCLLGWTGDNGDPDNFLYVLLSSAAVKSGSNRSRYMNGNFDRWLDLGKKTADPAKRIKYYRRAQEIVHKDIPWLTIAHSIVVEPMRKNVKGFKLSPLGLRQFKPVWIDK
jgi:ABC-type transport system substrate-binding protein